MNAPCDCYVCTNSRETVALLRRTAEALRRQGTPEALELVGDCERMANAEEQRQAERHRTPSYRTMEALPFTFDCDEEPT